ncbi:unnamed protein product [Dibothriocephalus latus]|uniref:Uncharacterized protein n=1 Tax=Dibothriocephalus latus TaxID=60516 RepID=A0A3P6U4X7_DIBLA|nr:unnamed protein product [Dibothriocephalus latus]
MLFFPCWVIQLRKFVASLPTSSSPFYQSPPALPWALYSFCGRLHLQVAKGRWIAAISRPPPALLTCALEI